MWCKQAAHVVWDYEAQFESGILNNYGRTGGTRIYNKRPQ